MSAPSVPIATDRPRQSRAGINLTVLRIEIRRLLRNRRTLVFALILPVVLFLFVGTNKSYANKNAQFVVGQNAAAFVAVWGWVGILQRGKHLEHAADRATSHQFLGVDQRFVKTALKR